MATFVNNEWAIFNREKMMHTLNQFVISKNCTDISKEDFSRNLAMYLFWKLEFKYSRNHKLTLRIASVGFVLPVNGKVSFRPCRCDDLISGNACSIYHVPNYRKIHFLKVFLTNFRKFIYPNWVPGIELKISLYINLQGTITDCVQYASVILLFL